MLLLLMVPVSSELAYDSLFISHKIRIYFNYINASSIKSSAKCFAERDKEKKQCFMQIVTETLKETKNNL